MYFAKNRVPLWSSHSHGLWAPCQWARTSRVVTPQYVPVDTVICFRASIPLVVSVLDYLMMGRELPKLRSWLALSGAPPNTHRSLTLYTLTP